MAWDVYMLVLRIFWRRMGLLLLANILWLGMSLLIVTWPAATAGLFYLVQRICDEELTADPEPARIADFWVGFRRHWQRAGLLAFGSLAALIVIGVSIRFYGESTIAPLNWLVGPISLIGVIWAGMQLYLFPLLLHRIGNSPLAVAREAFLMTIGYPLDTVLLFITVLIFATVATLLAGPILLILFAFVALLQTMALRAILSRRGEMTLVMTPEQREARDRQRT